MHQSQSLAIKGAGLGLRRDMLVDAATLNPDQVNFWEVAPENWLGLGGRFEESFRELTDKFLFVSHGLSLSLGSPAPLDIEFVKSIKQFFRDYNIRCYTEHLSYCSDYGHMYDLMPIPFTVDAVRYVADRIKRVQDILEMQIAVENVSYYACTGSELSEIDFINAVLDEANCGLLLDVNNVYVNSINHGYDPLDFIKKLPSLRIFYLHIAGHYQEDHDLIIDTHGADVIDPVWQLLQQTYEQFGVIPTLLERDFNIPPINTLLEEVDRIRFYQQSANKMLRPARQAVYINE